MGDNTYFNSIITFNTRELLYNWLIFTIFYCCNDNDWLTWLS